MLKMTVTEFNEKYYIDYKKEFENGIVFEGGVLTVGKGNHIGYSDLFITDVNTGKEYYQSKQFTSLTDEIESFCKENQIVVNE